jgi:hypothetical protein
MVVSEFTSASTIERRHAVLARSQRPVGASRNRASSSSATLALRDPFAFKNAARRFSPSALASGGLGYLAKNARLTGRSIAENIRTGPGPEPLKLRA